MKLIVALTATGISALLLGPGCATSTTTLKTRPEAHKERTAGCQEGVATIYLRQKVPRRGRGLETNDTRCSG